MATTDNARFLRIWHEVNSNKIGINFKNKNDAINSNKKWFILNKGGGYRKWYGLNGIVINWYNDGSEIKDAIIKRYNGGSYTKEIRSENRYFTDCLTWSALSSDKLSARYSDHGALFDSAGSSMFPTENSLYILAFVNSYVAEYIISVLNPTVNYGAGVMGKLPLIKTNNENIKQKASENIEISKFDWDSHETSWDFQRNELLAVDEQTYMDNINIFVEDHYKETGERLCIDPAAPQLDSLAWRIEQYKQKWEHKFKQLHENEEELNRQFIDIYGLQDELTPDVPLNEITILQQGEISIE